MTTTTMRPGEYEALLQARLAEVRASRRTPRHARTQPRGRVRSKAAVFMAATALLIGAVSVFADGGSFSVEVADKTGYEVGTTTDGAIVEYIGDDNVTFGASGSGIFESFLQTQDDPSEEGYNTDGDKEFDTGSSPTFNHAILVSEIPVVTCESLDGSETTAGLCWELFADINDSNAKDPAAAQIQLTELEIWFTDDDEITGYDQGGTGFGGDADLTYDFEGTVFINDVNQGSGRGDLRYLIPLNGIDFPIPADCDYGSSTCETFFVVYTEWGDPADGEYKSDSGFEEWKVKRYPFLDVTKTAATTFTRTFEWTIDKSVTPDSWAIFDGDSGTSDYTVDLTKGAGTDSAWAVSGTITIENTSEQDATIVSVDDVVSGAGAASVICGVTFPHELEEGDTLVCTYSKSLSDGANRTNTATATLVDGPVFTDDAAVTFGSPTTLVNDTVNVTDTFAGDLGEFSASDSATYDRTFECGADAGQHDNTATIVETGQFDDASVTVTCYDLSVTKTADESRTRTFEWEIDKSVNPDTWDLFDGDSGTSEYTVDITQTGFTDSAWHVEGDITIHNNHPTLAADLTAVTDAISGFGAATVECPSLTVPAAGDLVCTYEADLPDGDTRTNTATATQQNYDYDSDGIGTADGTTDYQGTAQIDFSEAVTTDVNDCVNVSDTHAGDLGEFCDSDSTTYERTFDCDADEGTHDNTATIDETGQSDDASVVVTCYDLSVTKTADESFTRTYEWDIQKSADQDALTLMPGEVFPVNYTVTVDVIGETDSDFKVEGDITIHNNHPTLAADLNSVVDEIFDGIAATVVCPSLTVPAGGDLVCTYEVDVPDASTRENLATATQQNYDYDSDGIGTAGGTTDYQGTEDAVFGDPTELVDECVDVNDTIGGFLGTVCVDDVPPPPTDLTYTHDVGPYTVEDCGEQNVPNTADLLTNDTGGTDESSWNIVVTIPCPEGCTLTMGYWKTHNEEFWGGAPEDPNWYLIGDVDGDFVSEGPNEDFFDTGMTWFDVFWENPAGRPYYQLAHQWMAAYLNKLSIEAIGGSIPAAVQDALDDGAVLLDEYDGSEPPNSPDIKGKDAKTIRAMFVSIAGVLGDFNEGTTGPGHCDEPIVIVDGQPVGGLVLTWPIGLLAPLASRMRRHAR